MRKIRALLFGLGLFTFFSAGAESIKLQDPTAPPGFTAATATTTVENYDGLILEGIFIYADRRYAVINGTFVHVGDDIRGVKILQIDQDKVLVGSGTTVNTLRLSGEPFKQPVTTTKGSP